MHYRPCTSMLEQSCDERGFAMSRSGTMRQLLGRCADFLLPAHCLLCGLFCGQGQLCAPCRGELPRLQQPCRQCALPAIHSDAGLCGQCLKAAPPWDLALAALSYEYPVNRLVHRFKFRRNLACGQFLADELLHCVQASRDTRPEVIIPVPLHFTRRILRGFNQAEFLAVELGWRIGIPVADTVLLRTRRTRAQSGLDRKARRQNLRGAFRCRGLPATRVALVDDVLTTGTTLSECARALRASGARQVSVWVAARVPKPAIPMA